MQKQWLSNEESYSLASACDFPNTYIRALVADVSRLAKLNE